MQIYASKPEFKKIWFTLISLALLIILLLSVLSYTMFNSLLHKEITTRQNVVIQSEQALLQNNIFERAQNILHDLILNKNCRDLFSLPYVKTNSINSSVYKIYHDLLEYRAINNDILANIVLYYPDKSFCISAIGGYKLLNQSTNDEYNLIYTQLSPAIHGQVAWKYILADGFTFFSSGLAIYYSPMSFSENTDFPVIALFISSDYLAQTFQKTRSESHDIMLLDNENNIIYSSTPNVLNPAMFDVVPMTENQIYSAVDNHTDAIFTESFITSTPFRLIVSVSINELSNASKNILLKVILINLLVLIASVILIAFLSKKLYSPLQMLTQAIQSIDSIPPSSVHNEYSVVQHGINQLSNLLSTSQRVLFANHSLLKNQALHDLLCSKQSRACEATLSYLNIHFSHPNFYLLGIEYCLKDAEYLSDEKQQVLSLGLIESVEQHLSTPQQIILGCLPEKNKICFLINATSLQNEFMHEMSSYIFSYFQCNKTRCHVVSIPESVNLLSSLSGVYEKMNHLYSARPFSENQPEIHMSLPNEEHSNDAYVLLTQLQMIKDFQSTRKIQQTLEQLFLILRKMHPEAAKLCFQKAMLSIHTYLCEVKQSDRIPEVLTASTESIWNTEEILQAWNELMPILENEDDYNFLKNVDNYIVNHLPENLSLEAVCDSLHYSPKYFSRKFRSLSGMTFTNYVTIKRLDQSIELLRQTSLSVEEIARQTGYNTAQYFTRKFREKYGMPPGEFRVKLKGNSDEMISETEM